MTAAEPTGPRPVGEAAVLDRQQQLAEACVALADTLVDDYDVVDLLHRLANTCVTLLGASAADILLVDQRGKIRVAASSTETDEAQELFRIESEEGPCLECVRNGAMVTVRDLSGTSDRWPRFVRAALDCGYRAVDAAPMRLRGSVIGGLNLFHARPEPLEPPDRRTAQALADVATIGILQQRSIHRASVLAEQLQGALNSRIVIEQAKGVVGQQHGVDFDVAFAAMRKYARDRNLKLGDVALAITRREIDSGQLMGDAGA